MSQGAYVGSVDAVRDFRAALATFQHEAREAITSYELELRRTLEWLLEDEPKRWQQQIVRCEEAVTEARIELERRRHEKLPGGGPPSCLEERKLLDRARLRRQAAEDKLAAMRKMAFSADREMREYTARANQFSDMLDADVPKALATLQRVLSSLESYAALRSPESPATASMARPESQPSSSVEPLGEASVDPDSNAPRDPENVKAEAESATTATHPIAESSRSNS